MRPWPDDVVALGGDYNPEQWPREVWREDVELMQRAGVTFATVGVFSWAWLEPEPGRYEFGWLDEVLDLLHEAGIAVDLATGTASPPPWFSHKYPDSLPVLSDGTRLSHGSRQAYCPSSTVFTEHAVALAEQMARRYHDHPALAMWHVCNEYGCHNLPCWCDICAEAFRAWLMDRHGDLDGLNEAWGTAFWCQRYTAWEQVIPPRITPTFPNPTQSLDFWRFCSDALLAQYVAERDVLHALSPGVPVTTNFMINDHFRLLDYARWAPEVDVVSTDHYVVHQPLGAPTDPRYDPRGELAFTADLTRGLAGGGPWVLMEHSTCAVNWQPVNQAKAAGPDAARLAAARGPRRRHPRLLPVARLARRRGEVPLRPGPARRHRHQGLPRGDRARRRVGAASASWSARGSRRRSRCCGTTRRRAPRRCRRCRRPRSSRARWRTTCTRPCAPPASRPTSCPRHRPVRLPRRPGPHPVPVQRRHAPPPSPRPPRPGRRCWSPTSAASSTSSDQVRLGGYPGAFRDLLGVRVEEFFPLPPGAVVTLDDGSTGDAVVRAAAGRRRRGARPLRRRPAAPAARR